MTLIPGTAGHGWLVPFVSDTTSAPGQSFAIGVGLHVPRIALRSRNSFAFVPKSSTHPGSLG